MEEKEETVDVVVEQAEEQKGDTPAKEVELEKDASDIVQTLALATRKDLRDPSIVENLRQQLTRHNLILIRIITPEHRFTIQGIDSDVQVRIAQKLGKVEQRLLTKVTPTI